MRYCGALGPRSSLRRAVTGAAREKVPFEDLLVGVSCGGPPAVMRGARRIVQAVSVVSARARSWAACLRRVLEVDPILCPRCRVEMKPIAVITDDCELRRLLEHLRLPTDFPKTAPARAPPAAMDEETSRSSEIRRFGTYQTYAVWKFCAQVDPRVESWEGVDEGPQPDWAAA